MKIYLTIFLSLLLVLGFTPSATFAAYNDVSLSGSTIISVGGYDLVISDSGTVDSITVYANYFTVDLSQSARFTITSTTDRRSYTVSPAQYLDSFECTTSNSTATISNNIWDSTITVTVTPSTSACSVAGGSSGAGGGGGGGGAVPTAVYTVIEGTTGDVTTPATPTTPTVTVPSGISATFTSTMSIGMSSSNVKRLQQLLNSDTDTMIASSGVGSPGNETEYYGNLTREAVKKFQAKYGIVSSGSESTTGYGLVGPSTRAKLAEVFVAASAVPMTPTTPTVSTGVSVGFTSSMYLGKSGADVKKLQQLLNSDADTMIASSGVGSFGNETEYYGSLTEKAVQKFQLKYGVVSSVSDPGYGYIGPMTRAKLAEVFGGTIIPTVPAIPTTPTTSADTSATDTLNTQIQSLLQQLETLQAELNTME